MPKQTLGLRSRDFCNNGSGQVALPFVLLVSAIIIEVAIAGVFIVFYLTNSEAGERFSLRAFTAAQAGVYDAMLQISRNKEYVAVYNSTSTYVFSAQSDSVSVSVYKEEDDLGDSYRYIISSLGSSFTRQKRLVAELLVNKITGEVQLVSILEKPIQE